MSRVNLIGLLPSEMEDLAVETGASRYRGRQLATWIYRKGVLDLESMSDLPKEFRAQLAERADIRLPEVERVTPSLDGSRKLVFRLHDGGRVSAVLMPDDDRLTLCLSTQVGCGFECAFCLTGTMGLERNLDASEIVGAAPRSPTRSSRAQRVTHMVFMGMGEPLANYAALVKAIRIFTDARLGLGYSPRRITVSTVGLVPGIERLGREDLKVNLAISLHAATDEVRGRLMPVNRSWNLADADGRGAALSARAAPARLLRVRAARRRERSRTRTRAQLVAASARRAREGEPDPVQRLGGRAASSGRRCRASSPSRRCS